MTDERLNEIATRAEKATPGPWSVPHFANPEVECNCVYVLSEGYAGSICDIGVDNGKRIGDGGNDDPPIEEAKANALLISHSRTDIPDLLAEVKRLRLALEVAQKDTARLKELSNVAFTLYRNEDPETGKLYDHFVFVMEGKRSRTGIIKEGIREVIDAGIKAKS